MSQVFHGEARQMKWNWDGTENKLRIKRDFDRCVMGFDQAASGCHLFRFLFCCSCDRDLSGHSLP